MDQGISSAVYVVVLSEPMNFPVSISPSKKMGDHTRQRKKSLTSVGIEPLASRFDHHCSTD